MIYKFSPALFFEESTPEIQNVILQFILKFLEKGFIWDIENLDDILGENGEKLSESIFFKKMVSEYLGSTLKEELDSFYKRATYNTTVHKYYLTTINVGLDKHQIHPVDAYKILTLPSRIVVENATNDWAFIEGIVSNYQNHKVKMPIFGLIKNAIDNHNLLPEHAGGSGEMVKRMIDLVDGQYQKIHYFKIGSLFDSDRKNSTYINYKKWKALLEYLKKKEFDPTDPKEWLHKATDKMRWHMLYKKEIENYIPLALLFKTIEDIGEKDKESLLKLTPDELDFIDSNTFLEKEHKNITPTIFKFRGIKNELEFRCEHHKIKAEMPNGTLEDVCETEKILLMIAKLI